jgi:hypothetical protein
MMRAAMGCRLRVSPVNRDRRTLFPPLEILSTPVVAAILHPAMAFTAENQETSAALGSARAAVLKWLRETHGDPHFLEDLPREKEVADATIVEQFMNSIARAGFDFTAHEFQAEGISGFVIHWTHQGSGFIGFRQPPPADTLEAAKILACAALLENEWCRSRLPYRT